MSRYRLAWCKSVNRIVNRIQKVLDDANVKPASVATAALGASAQRCLKPIIERGKVRRSRREIARVTEEHNSGVAASSLQGRCSPTVIARVNEVASSLLLNELMDRSELVESKMARLEREIGEYLRAFEEEMEQGAPVERHSICRDHVPGELRPVGGQIRMQGIDILLATCTPGLVLWNSGE